MVEYVDSAEELVANLEGVRDDLCADAETIPDSELRAIAKWAWDCWLNNRVYRGRDSAFAVNRQAQDALRRWNNETDAIALYVLLVDLQRHTPGKRFALGHMWPVIEPTNALPMRGSDLKESRRVKAYHVAPWPRYDFPSIAEVQRKRWAA